tara:strand:+ start:2839 stop:2949 length:111 start_codon:yes stop_codon:yes gene_type:complete
MQGFLDELAELPEAEGAPRAEETEAPESADHQRGNS